jgi:hypothetical protein
MCKAPMGMHCSHFVFLCVQVLEMRNCRLHAEDLHVANTVCRACLLGGKKKKLFLKFNPFIYPDELMVKILVRWILQKRCFPLETSSSFTLPCVWRFRFLSRKRAATHEDGLSRGAGS